MIVAGVAVDRAEFGTFGPSTAIAVEAFQEARGLLPTGHCDTSTWHALVEAGYRLGDRLLYLRTPMLRGDDVEVLQRGLGALGFDAGRVDGILGPETDHALRQFQRNAGLTPDGVCGTEVRAALARLGARTTSDTVAGVRERERLRSAPPGLQDRRVVIGEQGGLEVLASTVGRLLHEEGATTAVLHHPDASAQARDANAFEGELYVGLQVSPDPRCQIAFYATEGFRSPGGATLASVLADTIPIHTGLPSGTSTGLRLPVLRETRMPAVVCVIGPAPLVVERTAPLATSIVSAIRMWVRAPIEG